MNSLQRPGKVRSKAFRDAYIKDHLGKPCDYGCLREGQQLSHILRGGKRTDERWNVCWLCLDCHTRFDSTGEKTRTWMFNTLVTKGQCTVEQVLDGWQRFGFQFEV